MPEPHSTVGAGLIQGSLTGAITLFMGAQVSALVAGLVSAILVSIWLDTINNRTRAAAAVLLSSLLAGYGSPIAAEYVVASATGIPNTDTLNILLALIIGAASPTAVPIAIGAFKKKVSE